MEADMAQACPNCGTRDYGTPYCVKCQASMDRSISEIQPSTVEPVHPESLTLASIPRRFLALMADYLIIGIIADIIGMAYRFGTGSSSYTMTFQAAFAISTLLFLTDFTVLIGDSGQTLGKKLLGVCVVQTDGLPVSYSRALGRTVGYYISSLFFGLGFLWALWDGNNQTWHDKLAGTLVVRT
ncbi:RDD family protein [bacterium]|nr:MAG: RDD family protein [bacterium]